MVAMIPLAIAIVIAVFVDVQSDYLGTRPEQTEGFELSVFPQWNRAPWLIGDMFPLLMAIMLVMLIVARSKDGTRHDRCRSTSDDNLVVSRP